MVRTHHPCPLGRALQAEHAACAEAGVGLCEASAQGMEDLSRSFRGEVWEVEGPVTDHIQESGFNLGLSSLNLPSAEVNPSMTQKTQVWHRPVPAGIWGTQLPQKDQVLINRFYLPQVSSLTHPAL